MKALLCYATMPESTLKSALERFGKLNISIEAIVTHYGDLHKARKILGKDFCYCISDYNHPSTWSEKLKYNIYGSPRNVEKSWQYKFNKELFDKLVVPKLTSFLPLTERYGPFEGGSMESEIRLIYDFSLASYILEKHKPEIAMFYLEPQTALENMLFILAQHFGIKTFVVRTGLFRHQTALAESFDTPIVDENWQKAKSTYSIDTQLNDGQDLHPKTIEMIDKILFEKKFKPDYMKDLKFIIGRKKLFLDLFHNKFQRDLFLFFGFEPPFGSILKYQLHKNYLQSISAVKVEGKKPIVFFPLHYQPELNTMPRGGEFVNQIKAIKMLSDSLPPNGHIFVKEHPGVFSKVHNVNKNFRPSTFYNWISRMPNVSLVPLDTSSDYLQDISDFVGTITGNAGVEAMIRGKRVIVFGYPTYLNGPGIIKVSTIEDVKEAFKNTNAENLNCESNSEKAREYIKAISKNCFHSYIDLNSSSFTDTRIEFWTETLLNGVEKYYDGEYN